MKAATNIHVAFIRRRFQWPDCRRRPLARGLLASSILSAPSVTLIVRRQQASSD
jgi:hypothetical protein